MKRNLSTTIKTIDTFGDARRLILETMIQLRDGSIPIQTGMAIAANMKVLNENLQCEINAAKLSMLAHENAHKFGAVVEMGRRKIGNDNIVSDQ